MEYAVSISFAIYLMALLLSPMIVAYYAGLRAALWMALTEVAIVVPAWLLISILTYFMGGSGSLAATAGGVAIYAMAGLAIGSVTFLLLTPIEAVAAGLAIAALGCGARRVWRRLRG